MTYFLHLNNDDTWMKTQYIILNVRIRTDQTQLHINEMLKLLIRGRTLQGADTTGKSHFALHYHDVTMDSIASQITSLTIVYSAVYSAADQRKHQSSASLAFVRGIHRGPVNSPHKGPVTRKMFPFDDVIMLTAQAMLPTAIVALFYHPPTQVLFNSHRGMDTTGHC